MSAASFGPSVVWQAGSFAVTETIVTTWFIMLLFTILSIVISRHLNATPARWQTAVEGAMVAIEAAIAEVVPATAVRQVLPFVATLWFFILVSNLCGLLPDMHAPTRDLAATGALALLVFASTHWFGIRAKGMRAYFRHYLQPNPILLPFHVISELTRTIALAIRLFGNIMSLEMAAMLILLIAGFLVPVPLLLLHAVEALVQAYIFGMLALIYIGGAIEQENGDARLSESTPSRHEGSMP